ncbi:MAG: pilin [Candidatus Paceibacterota bacterium]
MKKLVYTLAFTVFAAPSVASAQGPTIEGIFFWIQDIINLLVPIIIAAAVLLFLWGVLRYILKSGEPEERKKAQQTMIWGIIGIFVMVSVWGIVNILVNTFNLDSAAPEGNIEDLVDLPLGDFGQDLEGTERCSDASEVRHVDGPRRGDCLDECATDYVRYIGDFCRYRP